MKKASKTKVSRTYALALYDAALAGKVLKEVWADILKLRGLLEENPSFLTYLSSPLWSEKDKEDVLQKTAKLLKLNGETLNCLRIVCQNHRINGLPYMLEDFKHIYYQKNNIEEAVVETIQPLSAVQDKKLKEILEKILAKKVVIDYQINPAILGGLRIKCGSQMLDDSLSAKLNYLENLMKGK